MVLRIAVLVVAGCRSQWVVAPEVDLAADRLDDALCDGVDDADLAAMPFDPLTGARVCPPYVRPAVFFAPHPDDETLGMAGAIREHLDAGREVFVELMTSGRGSIVLGKLADGGTHPWHDGSHDYSLTETAFGESRVLEFLDATARLGVTGVYVSDFDDPLAEDDVTSRIDWWVDGSPSGLSLKGTAEEPRSTTSGRSHPDHAAVWQALLASGHADVRGYLVYKYYGTGAEFSFEQDIGPWCDAKAEAHEAYRVWDPEADRFGIGYHSVPELFDASAADCLEYVVRP